jgi:hypothetical protein
MIDRAAIIAAHPLPAFLEARGIILTRGSTNRCPVTEHKPGHNCMAVDATKDIWFCNDCKVGGSVVDYLMAAEGIDAKEALERLGAGSNGHSAPPRAAETPGAPQSTVKPKIVKLYDYTDEKGVLLFQVVRMDPKDFRQRAPDGSGGWIYKLEGVRRALYNLPKVLAADVVFIPEGEKDADTIGSMGLVATTNCGGSKKWLPEYSPFLRGKEVVLLPDNDKAGEEHLETLRAALGKVVKSMRIVKMPEGIKDISEFASSFQYPEEAKNELIGMAESAEVLFQGEHVPVYSMAELEGKYRDYIKRSQTVRFSIGAWLPTFNRGLRPLVPGDVFTILAATGCGKTMLLQNIAINTKLETLMFEVELPDSLTFERFVAMATKSTGHHVESTYEMNGSKEWKESGKLNHIMVCLESSLTPEMIEKIINNTALKTSVRPALVLLDYVQLVRGQGDSRYERLSEVAEQLKIIAKRTSTIIIVASQISRPQKKDAKPEEREVTLTDGKDSGSLENSSGLVWGAWRDGTDPNRIWLRVLKNTKGTSGLTIPCRISDSLLIHEETKEAPELPARHTE